MKTKFAPATIATFVKRARQVFEYAIGKKLVTENAFKKLKIPSQVNKSREEFISHDTINKVIAEAPTTEWRLIIALARYGGLRIPSEALELTWDNIDWEKVRITVVSPKLAHLPSKGIRIIPIFPELRPHLEAAFEEAAVGSVNLITTYRESDTNLRTHFLRIITRAGVQPWGRLFQNLRSSRETELVADHPIHVVTYWLGNSPKIADRHYLQIRDADYDKATRAANSDVTKEVGSDQIESDSVAEKIHDGQKAQENRENVEIYSDCRSGAKSQKNPRQESNVAGSKSEPNGLPGKGFRGDSEGGFQGSKNDSAANSVVISSTSTEPLLRELVAAWPDLDGKARGEIVRIVRDRANRKEGA